MFKVVVLFGYPTQIFDTGRDARLVVLALQSQEHQRRRRGDGFEGQTENTAIAIIDAALLQDTVTEQFQAFLDARVPAQPDAPQRQTRPGCRLNPREIALGPRPADQAIIDVANVLVFTVYLSSFARQQGGSDSLEGRGRIAERRLGEEDECRRPDGFRSAAP